MNKKQHSGIFKCLFPAAGYGTRFLPVTKSSPKEMLPIIDKPLIHYGVEEAYTAGIRDMMFIVGRNKESIVNYFDINVELENHIKGGKVEWRLNEIRNLLQNCIFSYIRQGEIKGLGHAILTARHYVESHAFAVCLADDLFFGGGTVSENKSKRNEVRVLAEMVKLYEKHRCTILATAEVPAEDISKYGIIDGEPIDEDLIDVRSLVEKPDADKAPSNLAIIGRYILVPTIFDYLKKLKVGAGGEIQLTDALIEQNRNERILAYKVREPHFDCGDPGKYANAIQYARKIRNLL